MLLRFIEVFAFFSMAIVLFTQAILPLIFNGRLFWAFRKKLPVAEVQMDDPTTENPANN